MRSLIKVLTILFAVTPLFFAAGTSYAKEGAVRKSGMEASIKADPSNNTLDVYVKDSKTGKAVIDAKVRATVIGPDGKRMVKDLSGMKMGEGYSYMGQVDFSKKGLYVLDIGVERGKTREFFNFRYER